MQGNFKIRCRRWIWDHRWRLLGAWIVIFSVIVSLGIRQNRFLAKQGKEAHDAICVLKQDYRKRIRVSREFLRDNPNGIPGVSSQVIRNTQHNLESTLKALRPVHCKGDQND